jgi:hypothetical protein
MKIVNAFWRIGPALVTDLPPPWNPARAPDSNFVDLALIDSKAVVSATAKSTAEAPTDPAQLLLKAKLPLPAQAASSSGADTDLKFSQLYLVSKTEENSTTTKTTGYDIFGVLGDTATGADALE